MKTENQSHNEKVQPNTAFLNELKQKLPEFVKDDKFDFNKFKAQLEEKNIDELSEGYQLNFIGKDYARRQAGEMPSTVIVPDEDQNKGEGSDSKNLFFTGDNLEVLRHLQGNYQGKIDVIYIDPPYNTGSDDFVYPDNFEYKDEKLKEMFGLDDNQLNRLKSIQGKASHSAWLTFMYPRLVLAKRLLADDGVIFISIDDNEQANLKLMMDEIFGEGNFVAQITVQMSKTQGMKVKAAKQGQIVKNKEFVIVYSGKVDDNIVRTPLYDGVEGFDGAHYKYFLDKSNNLKSLQEVIRSEPSLDAEINRLQTKKKFNAKNMGYFVKNSSLIEDFIFKNSKNIYQDAAANITIPDRIVIKINNGDKVVTYCSKSKTYKLVKVGKGTIRQLLPLDDSFHITDDFSPVYGRSTVRGDWWADFNLDMMNISKEDGIEYKNGKKPVRLIKQLIKWSGIKNGIVLDFFAGSATTASAVMQDNAENGHTNKFIMVQIDEDLDHRLTVVDSSKRKEIKKLIKMLDNVGRGHSIDEMSQQRIVNAATKIKAEHDDLPADFDGSFKHYRVVKPTFTALEQIEEFDPELDITGIDVAEYSSKQLGVAGNATGEATILRTWLTKDGFPFDVDIKPVQFAGYTGYYVGRNRLYLISEGWNDDCTEALVNQLGLNQLQVNMIIALGYSFSESIETVKELENALNQLDNKVTFIRRY